MELDDSDCRYSLLIAGILVATIFSIFLVIALGAWGHSIFSGTGIEPVPGGLPLSNGENTMENNNPMDDIPPGVEFLPITEGCMYTGIDTDPGWVYVHDFMVQDPLPLCLPDGYNLGGATVISYGGYDFNGGMGFILQGKSDECKDIKGTFSIDLIDAYSGPAGDHCPWVPDPCCVVDYWEIGFNVVGCVNLDSNHVPNVIGDCCVPFDLCDGLPDNLDKWVDLAFITCWSGCEKPDQDFQII